MCVSAFETLRYYAENVSAFYARRRMGNGSAGRTHIAAFEVPAAEPESPLITAINLYVHNKVSTQSVKRPT